MHYTDESNKGYSAGASADIPAFTAVKMGTSGDLGKIVAAAAATDKIIGVTTAKIKAGYQGEVRLRSASGTINITVGAGGAIALGDAVTSDASGLGLTTTTAGHQLIGYALEAGASGALIELLPSTGKF